MFDPHYAYIHDSLINWAREYLKSDINQVSQINATRYSYVLKIQLGDQDYYLKHVPQTCSIEAALSQHLKQKCNVMCVPEILAFDKPLSCFITKSRGHKTLRQRFDGAFDKALMLEGVALYKSIQHTSTDYIEEYLALGVSDWRFKRFSALYEGLLDDKACMEAWDVKSDQQAYLKQKKTVLEMLCAKIDALNIPDTLNHSDFHDNNIVINETSGALTIIDWSEVNIGHPLLSLSSCLYGLNDRYDFSTEQHQELRRLFFGDWGIPDDQFEEICEMINTLGQIYYVLCFQDLIHRTGHDFANWKGRVRMALKIFSDKIENYSA